jgi:hypothetical protein
MTLHFHTDTSLNETIGNGPKKGHEKGGGAPTDKQDQTRRRNFALMQVKAMQTTADHHLKPFLEIWQYEPPAGSSAQCRNPPAKGN